MSFTRTLARLGHKTALEVEERFDQMKTDFASRLGVKQEREIYAQPYRGYGTTDVFFLQGRVLRGKPLDPAEADQSLWNNILDAYRRFESDEVSGAYVKARFAGIEEFRYTDGEGYYNIELPVNRDVLGQGEWNQVQLEVRRSANNPVAATATTEVLVPSGTASFGVISDVDDTVIMTGAADLLAMARITFLRNARTRVPFDGVAALYDALAAGPDKKSCNPFFFVSSSPFNLYDLLDDFLEQQKIRKGVLLLRDLGLESDRWIKAPHLSHKQHKIERILGTYSDLDFVLIGDSGQEDPEIYRQVAREFPGRIRAIYIRHVGTEARQRAVEELALELAPTGTPMILVHDSGEAAAHAAQRGLIHSSAVDDVREACRRDEERPTAVEVLADETLG